MATTIEIFCCYARKDQELLRDLKTHLAPLQRQGLISIWNDTDITAGTNWEAEISKHLNTAHIILLLISPDFMASDYCYGIEMKRAIERHERGEAHVIPVILRHVYWRGGPLGELQALPKDAKPVTDQSWQSLDRAFFDVTEGIMKAIESMTKPDSRNSSVEKTSSIMRKSSRSQRIPKEVNRSASPSIPGNESLYKLGNGKRQVSIDEKQSQLRIIENDMRRGPIDLRVERSNQELFWQYYVSQTLRLLISAEGSKLC